MERREVAGHMMQEQQGPKCQGQRLAPILQQLKGQVFAICAKIPE